MFLLSCIFVTVCDVFEWKRICSVCYRLFIYAWTHKDHDLWRCKIRSWLDKAYNVSGLNRLMESQPYLLDLQWQCIYKQTITYWTDSLPLKNVTTLYALSSQDLILQRHKSWSLCVQWVQLRWEVIIRFVDIGGINDHQRFILFS
jgi:hypothetical protein